MISDIFNTLTNKMISNCNYISQYHCFTVFLIK